MYTVESPNKRPVVILTLVGRLSSFAGLKCISIIGKLTFGDTKNVLVERLYLYQRFYCILFQRYIWLMLLLIIVQNLVLALSLILPQIVTNFFCRIGDKRPDKDGIYLPTCLTEFAIYSRMKEEIGSRDEAGMICFSQFNKIFRTNFSNVTIPKV